MLCPVRGVWRPLPLEPETSQNFYCSLMLQIMFRNSFRALHTRVHVSSSADIKDWENEDGYVHVALYLSVLFVALSAWNRLTNRPESWSKHFVC